jgi:TonB family protein
MAPLWRVVTPRTGGAVFEKAGAAKAAAPPWMQPWGISASVATHVVLIAGIAVGHGPSAGVPRPVEETTYLVIAQAGRAPALPSRLHAGSEKAAAAGRVPGGGTGAPASRPKSSATSGLDVLVKAPGPQPGVTVMDVPALGQTGVEMRVLLAMAAALARNPETTRGIGSGTAGEPDAIAAEMLAELPRMVNRQEVIRLLARLHPLSLKRAGEEGEVMINFVIGVDGRVEMRSIRVTAATHPELVGPSFRAAERMRFRPARLHGKPVRVRASLPLRWVMWEGVGRPTASRLP